MGPFHERFIHCSWNSMEKLVCSHPGCSEAIAIQFCTWHESYAVVTCTEFGSDIAPYNAVTLKQNLHRIWSTMENRYWNVSTDAEEIFSCLNRLLRVHGILYRRLSSDLGGVFISKTMALVSKMYGIEWIHDLTSKPSFTGLVYIRLKCVSDCLNTLSWKILILIFSIR